MPLGPRRTKRRRNAPKWAPNDWVDASMALLRRCGGKCWWCGKDLEGRAARHHRQRRRDGGDRLSNLVLLHPECHNIYPKSVHQNPTEAIDYGFIVPSWAEPDAFAIFVKNNYWLLDDDGNMKGPVESPT